MCGPLTSKAFGIKKNQFVIPFHLKVKKSRIPQVTALQLRVTDSLYKATFGTTISSPRR